MPTFSSTKTVQATPAVAVTSISTPSYEQIRRSLGDNVYHVYQLYLATANSISQISSVIQYKKYQVDGHFVYFDLVPFVNPYQKQKTLFFKLDSNPVVIDGQNALNFILMANTTLKFKLYSVHLAKETFVNEQGQPALGESNFKQFETATGLFGFFDDFNDNIEWQNKNQI